MRGPVTLPSLARLTDVRPCVVIDSREQDPLPISRLPAVRGTLQTGDYSAAGLEHLLSVERKSVPDLVSCCCGKNRERFERELHRLRGFRFRRLLVVGTKGEIERHEYRCEIKPVSVLHTLAAFEVRYDLPIVYCPTAEEAGQQVESWIFWFTRELLKSATSVMTNVTVSKN